MDVEAWISTTKAKAAADLKGHFESFADLYDKRLWHQLTVAIERFVATPNTEQYLIPMYRHFIHEWEGKMNRISLVRFASKASHQLPTHEESLAFLQPFVNKLKTEKNSLDAFVLISMEAAHYKLLIGKIEECKLDIDQCETIQDKLTTIDPTINASFYRVSADFYKVLVILI